MKKLLFGFLSFFTLTSAAQTTIIGTTNNGDFENATPGSSWNTVNPANSALWYFGTVSKCSGVNAAYVGTAAANNNYTMTNSRIAHLYRDVTFPAGQTVITLTFSWKAGGESIYDGLKIYLGSTLVTPVANTAFTSSDVTAVQLGSTWYNLQTTCTTATITITAAQAGNSLVASNKRLVFSWQQDNSGGANPAATLDNVVLTSIAPAVPGCAVIGTPVNGATNVCNGSLSLNWTAPATGGAPTGYKLYFGTDVLATNIVNGTNLGNVLTYNPGALLPGTTYYWRIVATNATGDAVLCSIWSFTTGAGCYPQTTASVSSCGGTYYDSGGSGAAYGNSESSIITFCPATAGQFVQVSFNSFVTESGLDILTIYNGANTSAPVLSTNSGSSIPCLTTATNASGCLTFKFVSDGSVTYAGWDATLSCVASIPGTLAGTTCANALSMTLPYTATGQTTACYINDYTNSSTGSCGTLYESGEDHVYAYTATTAECIGITLTNASTTSIGYQVYSGCPGSAGTTCIGNNGGAVSGTLSGNVTLPAAGTYYLVIDTYSTPFNANYDLAVSSYGSGPGNDLPCNASLLTLGVNDSGDNTCSGSTGEPAAPSCWTTGTNNSVWYKVVPTGTTMKVRTRVGTLTNTQIAVYSGTCGAAMTLVTGACNDNAPVCGSTTDYSSLLSLTGLTAGATYYIRVDGYANLTGTFGIVVIDGSAAFPSVPGQDCGLGNPVCNSSMSVSNPGYQGIGATCDLPTSYCLSSSEVGSAWYTWTTNAAGFINFDIVPNDWPGAPSTTSTDYDFALWKLSGTVNCSTILAGSSTPAACNYSALGVTGVSPTGNAPAAYPGYDAAYETQVACASGDTWLLLINNYTASTQGFTLNFSTGSGAAPINYTASPTSVNWSGGSSTAWNTANNWGGCAIPVCGIDANVSVFTNQPIITSAMGAQYVKNLTINLGATLTLQAGSILHICGNLVNNGTINASPTSTIIFDNASVAQTMTGNFTGLSDLGNLTITKTGGSVLTNDDVDVAGNFTTSNATSTFDSNGKSIRVAGNFVNANGNTTYANTGSAGTLTFYGSAAQTYTQGSSQLDLNKVTMTHTSTGVTLNSNMYIKPASGILTLTQGKIITGSYEVNVANTASAAVTAGNTTSFVQGNLRRYVAATGAYDFPVGQATKGYQRANINFTAATSIGNLLARFDPWSIAPGIQGGSECATTYNLTSEDNGWWTITADANATTGTYTTTLYPAGATNTSPASGWTVMKTPSSEFGVWALVGTCNPSSTATTVLRSGMNGFSLFGVAQATDPLPIELVSFTGQSEGTGNRLLWVTASETNNDYFTLERSEDAASFEAFAQKDGAGNSSVIMNYNAYDPSPYNGITYYRLKQTDFNGKFTYSAIIAIENKLNTIAVSNVHPNPTTDDLNFDFYSPVKGTVKIRILDYTGRVVSDKTIPVEDGQTSLKTEMSELAKGVYSLKIEFSEGNFRSVSKVIKY